MARKLVWIRDASAHPMLLSCGHTTLANGGPTRNTHLPVRVGDEWLCEMCALGSVAQMDQDIAREMDPHPPQ